MGSISVVEISGPFDPHAGRAPVDAGHPRQLFLDSELQLLKPLKLAIGGTAIPLTFRVGPAATL